MRLTPRLINPRRKCPRHVRSGSQKCLPKINLRALRVRQSFEPTLGWNVGPDNPLDGEPAKPLSFRRRIFLRSGVIWIIVVAALLGHSNLEQQAENQIQLKAHTRAKTGDTWDPA